MNIIFTLCIGTDRPRQSVDQDQTLQSTKSDEGLKHRGSRVLTLDQVPGLNPVKS